VIRLPIRMQWAFPLPVLLHLPVVRSASTGQVPASLRVRVAPCVPKELYPILHYGPLAGTSGVSHVLNASLSACQALRTPTDPRISHHDETFVEASSALKLSPSVFIRFDEAVPDFRMGGHPSGRQSSLCTLHLFCSVVCTSSTHATLGTSGW